MSVLIDPINSSSCRVCFLSKGHRAFLVAIIFLSWLIMIQKQAGKSSADNFNSKLSARHERKKNIQLMNIFDYLCF